MITIATSPRLSGAFFLLVFTGYSAIQTLGQETQSAPTPDTTANQPAEGEIVDWESKISVIDSQISGLVASDGPGVAVRISVGDKVLLEKGYGLADLSHSVPVSDATKFRIGSITKNITAAAILKLQEEGKLKLSDTLSTFLPGFAYGEQVTITHLLNHTSGIPSYTNAPDFLTTVSLPIEPQELIDSFKDQPLEFAPGTKYAYNNSAYFLLGHIVAKLSNKSFDAYLRQEFFNPLGMKNTGIYETKDLIQNEAYGYSFGVKGYEKALNWDMSRAGGAGAIYSTVEDLDIWVRAFYGGKVLNQDSVQQALTSNILENEQKEDTKYGFGWVVDDLRGLKRISHGGGLQGFSSYLVFYPDLDLCIVVLHNALPSSPAISPSGFAEKIVATLYGDRMDPLPQYEVDPTVTTEVMARYVGRYDYQSAVMDITLEDGQVFAHLTGQPQFPIFPMSETKFFWKVVDAQVEFVLDEENNVVAAMHTQNGTTFRADRLPEIESLDLPEEVLERHVGRYKFASLGHMIVQREDDHLTAQLDNQAALQIFPRNETDFVYKIVPAEVTFGELKEGKSQAVTIKQAGLMFEGRRVE